MCVKKCFCFYRSILLLRRFKERKSGLKNYIAGKKPHNSPLLTFNPWIRAHHTVSIHYFCSHLMKDQEEYETVVGLEVHAQLLTQSKLFCGDSISFGAPANTQVSPITLGHPGTLPKANQAAIELAVKMGLACTCEIQRHNYFARKNYFYPDLPKGYQVSQHTTPICAGGFVSIQVNGEHKKIRLTRIHLEEDAGKSLHDMDAENTCIDYNRAGTPLIEIVSEPDLRSGEEAFAFLTEVRKLVRYLDVCDGNMEEGSFRCDANVSVRKKGDPKLGIRVEVKNLNSVRNVKKAIEFEAGRLIKILQNGNKIAQETRSFDAGTDTTFATREKEEADDYRYFPEPDLTPITLDETFIKKIAASIPALPAQRIKKYIEEYGLSMYDSQVLTEDKQFADYFEAAAALSRNYKATANWLLGPVKTWLNEQHISIDSFPLQPRIISSLVMLIEEGKLNFSVAAGKLFPLLIASPGTVPEIVAVQNQLIQQSDSAALEPLIDAVLEKHAAKVLEYKNGKKGLLSLFVGEVIKQSKGKADPKVTNKILLEKLKSK